MNDKELKKLLSDKQKEMEKMLQEYEHIKYEKQIRAMCEGIQNSPDVLGLIKEKNLNSSDAKLLGRMVAKKIVPIYRNFADLIESNQARRTQKNEKRKVRRAMHNIPTTDNKSASPSASSTTDQVNNKAVSSVAATANTSDNQMRRY